MVTLNYDVYQEQSQPVPIEVIVGYAEQYFADYIGTQVTITDGEGNETQYDFLPYLVSILQVESNLDLYAASEVDQNDDGVYEASFGLFQINWENERGQIAHAPTIVDKMIRDGVIQPAEKSAYLQNFENLNEDQVNIIVQYMSGIDIQFEIAAEIYKNRKQFPEGSNGDFQDWGARLSPTTATNYEQNVNIVSGLTQQEIQAAMSTFTPTPINFDIQGQSAYDDPRAPMADIGATASEAEPKDKLQFLYNEIVLPSVDPNVSYDANNTFMNFVTTYFDQADNLTDQEMMDLYSSGVISDPMVSKGASVAINQQYNNLAGNAVFRNPFLLSSQTAEPTLANAVLGEVYQLFKQNAGANGILDPSYLATTFLMPRLPAMRRAVQSYLDANGNFIPGYTFKDVVNDIADLASGNGRDWQFGSLPDYGNPEDLYDKNQLRNTATGLVSRILLDDNPNFVNKVTQDYTDYLIANPTSKVDFNTYVYNAIKNTGRYKSIYKNKPEGITEDQYISIYNNAASVASPADQEGLVAAQAMAGGTAETTQRVAQFTESGTRSNAFINGIEQSAQNLSRLLGKAT
jgi:hypothetical protein